MQYMLDDIMFVRLVALIYMISTITYRLNQKTFPLGEALFMCEERHRVDCHTREFEITNQ